MKETFSHTKIKDLKGLSKWDTSKVETFERTFDHLDASDVSGINKWDLSSGTNFDNMFYKAKRTPKWEGTFTEEGTYVK